MFWNTFKTNTLTNRPHNTLTKTFRSWITICLDARTVLCTFLKQPWDCFVFCTISNRQYTMITYRCMHLSDTFNIHISVQCEWTNVNIVIKQRTVDNLAKLAGDYWWYTFVQYKITINSSKITLNRTQQSECHNKLDYERTNRLHNYPT
jgi:hypothetical protein